MSKHARRPFPGELATDVGLPSIAQCLYHRCEEHEPVPQLDSSDGTGAECGACIAESVTALAAQKLLLLDGYADRLSYGAALRGKLRSARDRLNLLQPGAGDYLELEETDGDK